MPMRRDDELGGRRRSRPTRRRPRAAANRSTAGTGSGSSRCSAGCSSIGIAEQLADHPERQRMGEALDQIDDGVGPAARELVEQLVGDAHDRRARARRSATGTKARATRRRSRVWSGGSTLSMWRANSGPGRPSATTSGSSSSAASMSLENRGLAAPGGRRRGRARARRRARRPAAPAAPGSGPASPRTAGTGRRGPRRQAPHAASGSVGQVRHRRAPRARTRSTARTRRSIPLGVAGVGVAVLLDDEPLVAEALGPQAQPPAELEPAADLTDGGVDHLVLVDVAEPALELTADLRRPRPTRGDPPGAAREAGRRLERSGELREVLAGRPSMNVPAVANCVLAGGMALVGRSCLRCTHVAPSAPSGSYPIFRSAHGVTGGGSTSPVCIANSAASVRVLTPSFV